MTRRRFGRLSAAWAGVDRYRRLNFAVVSCLFVMFGLVVSLVITIRWVDHEAAGELTTSYQLDEISRELIAASNAVERLESGSAAAATELAAQRERLLMLSDELIGTDEDARAELVFLMDSVAILADAGDSVLSELAQPAETMRRLDELADRFAARADAELAEVETTLDVWFWWIQTVAVIASIVFLLAVMKAILPLSRSIERSLLKLQSWQERAGRETARRTLTVQVSDGLEVADDEPSAYAVLSRALEIAAPDHAAEILLADSSKAHLRVAVEHPTNGSAGCGVMSPWSCPAVRRGSTMVFDDSQAIRSCPHLEKHENPCSAVCSPLTFMGQPMGVVHATGPVGETPPRELVEDLTVVAAEAATRIGTLRAFAKAELQASTDVLTGLPNRRATEDHLRGILGVEEGGAIALIEIDGLVDFNERLGKAAGDRAVTAVADALRHAARPDDFVGRWAGAEFVVVFAGQGAAEASAIARRLTKDVEQAVERAELGGIHVVSGVADTRLAESVRELFEVANSSLGFARRATLRRRSVGVAVTD